MFDEISQLLGLCRRDCVHHQEAQTTKAFATSGSTSVPLPTTTTTSSNPSTTRNVPISSLTSAAILKAEMMTRSPPSNVTLCRDRFSMAANGTVRPIIDNLSRGQRQCSFIINATANELIQMTCSVVSLNNSGAELVIYGGSEINVNPPVVNRIYTSRSNSMILVSTVDNTDWFDCKWKMVPVPPTTEYQLCRDGASTTPNGTIQRPAEDTTEPRTCMFTITVPSDHRIQLMCSNVTLTGPGNYLQFLTVSDTVIADLHVGNWVHTHTTSESIYLFSQFSNQDWFTCKWTTIEIPLLVADNKS